MNFDSETFNPENPSPGIYLDLDNEEYHRSRGVSKSSLVLYDDNPEKYEWKYILGNREEEEKHFHIGRAYHYAALEPDKFEAKYMLGPAVKSKADKKWKESVAAFPDKTLLTVNEYDMVMGMADKTRRVAGSLLVSGMAEISVYAIDPETGELVKIRPDWLVEDVIVDLKSTTNACREKFFRDMYAYSYHIQAAMYPEVFNLIGARVVHDFVFIAAEKEPPYSCALYRASDHDRQIGSEAYHRILRRYSRSRRYNAWPSYNDGKIIDTSLPGWAVRAEETAAVNDPAAAF